MKSSKYSLNTCILTSNAGSFAFSNLISRCLLAVTQELVECAEKPSSEFIVSVPDPDFG